MHFHFVKSVGIRSFSGPYFPAFGLNTERYSVSLHIQSKCGKIRTKKTPNTNTFYTVFFIIDIIQNPQYISERFSTYAKFSEKLTLLKTNNYVYISGSKKRYLFGKFCERTKWMILRPL